MDERKPPQIIVQYHEHLPPKASSDFFEAMKVFGFLISLFAILGVLRSCAH